MKYLKSFFENQKYFPDKLDAAMEEEWEPDILEFLAENPNFDVSIHDHALIEYCADRGFDEAITDILSRPNAKTTDVALSNAIQRNNVDVAIQLLQSDKNGININHPGYQHLRWAINSGEENLANLMLDLPDINPMLDRNWPILCAIEQDMTAIIRKIFLHPNSKIQKIVSDLRDANIDLDEYYDIHPLIQKYDQLKSKFDI
jgi:hypothetical protein